MKEEELLLFKEELAMIKASRNCLLGFGIFIVICGLIVSVLCVLDIGDFAEAKIIPIVSGAIGIICCIIAELKCGRDYENKLKELKKDDRIKNEE